MEIKKLTKNYHEQLKNLIQIVSCESDKEKLIVISNEEIENIFENPSAIVYGAVENEKLLAISGLFFDESDYFEIMELLNIKNKKVAEIAECMVLPEVRGNNLMFKINQMLIIEAQKLGFEYVIATAHPENISSKHSLERLGMTTSKRFNRYGKYLRDCYIIKL